MKRYPISQQHHTPTNKQTYDKFINDTHTHKQMKDKTKLQQQQQKHCEIAMTISKREHQRQCHGFIIIVCCQCNEHFHVASDKTT